MKKKAQVKFGETFGVIIIVYFVIVAGFAWYNKENSKSIEELIEDDKFERSFEIYYFVVNNDLIRVSQRGVIDDELDLNGLRAFEKFSQNTENQEFLRRQLGESTVTISIFDYNTIQNSHLDDVDFKHYKGGHIILYNNTPEGISDVEIFRTLIPVRNEAENRIDMGLLEVKVYVG
jgi:hypothetical protein